VLPTRPRKVTPSISLVLFHEKYSDMSVGVHSASPVATLETGDGATLYLRYINTPKFMDTFGRRDVVWICKF
jgi:hypothetical protein